MAADYREQAKKWYNSKRWQRMRANQLQKHPYCQCPHHRGNKSVLADTVDHDTPHRGNPKLFWDARNLRSMTKSCHDSMKQSQEKGGAGFLKGCDAKGDPLSQDHEWWQ